MTISSIIKKTVFCGTIVFSSFSLEAANWIPNESSVTHSAIQTVSTSNETASDPGERRRVRRRTRRRVRRREERRDNLSTFSSNQKIIQAA